MLLSASSQDDFAARRADKGRHYHSTTLTKAFSILDTLAESGASQSLSDICSATSLKKPTVYRLLNAMKSCGIVSYGVGGYALGLRLCAISRSASFSSILRRATRRELACLAETLGCKVTLSTVRSDVIEVLDSHGASHLDTLVPGDRLRPTTHNLGRVIDESIRMSRGRNAIPDVPSDDADGFARSTDGQFIARAVLDARGLPICVISVSALHATHLGPGNERHVADTCIRIRNLLHVNQSIDHY